MNKKGIETGPKSNMVGMILLVIMLGVLIFLGIKFVNTANSSEKLVDCTSGSVQFENASCVAKAEDCKTNEGFKMAYDSFGCQKRKDGKNICCFKDKISS